MPVLDTSGMLCTCRKKLINAGTDNGCHVLVCPVHSKKSYRIPVTDPRTLPFPWECMSVWVIETGRKMCGNNIQGVILEDMPDMRIPVPTPVPREYRCKECKKEIDERQAKRTFEEEGRALCGACAIYEKGKRV